METEYKYCWIDIETGKFSNTWDQESQNLHGKGIIEHAQKQAPNWKLIKFTCLTDPNFEFTNHMKLR